MRISDWSSDVFSSDLLLDRRRRLAPGNRRRVGAGEAVVLLQDLRARHAHLQALQVSRSLDRALDAMADRNGARIDAEVEHRREALGLDPAVHLALPGIKSEEHTSELQSLMRISYAVFCLKQKQQTQH